MVFQHSNGFLSSQNSSSHLQPIFFSRYKTHRNTTQKCIERLVDPTQVNFGEKKSDEDEGRERLDDWLP